MQVNTALGILLPVVFTSCVLTLAFLWVRRSEVARQEKAKQAFTRALATKNIKIDPVDVTTKQGHGGTILCKVVYGRILYANGEYRANGKVFVRHYPRPDDDSDWPFWYPATPNP